MVINVVFLNMPTYPNATVEIIVTALAGQDALVGVCAIGHQFNLGTTNHGTGISIIDYSVKNIDSFGNFDITQRGFSKRADYDVSIDTGRVGFVQNYLSQIRSTPVVWIGNEDFESTIIYGYYRDFDIVLSSPLLSQCNIVVEGLT